MAKVSQGSDGSSISFLAAMAVCFLYLLACFLPCVDCGPGFEGSDPGFPDIEAGWHFGLLILLFGWDRSNIWPWSANVFLALGLVCLWRNRLRSAFWLGILASGLGLTAWWVRRYDTLMTGYYLWQASLLALAIGAAFAIRRSARKRAPTPLTEAQKQDLQRRLAVHEANRHAGSTWEEVKARLQKPE